VSSLLEGRFQGCLVGQALGDAVGFLVEGHPGAVCEAFVGEFLRPLRVPTRARGAFSFGQYSDDTQLARELGLSLLAAPGFDPADYAARIASLFSDRRVVGRGRATEEAARRLAAGVAWDAAGTPAPAAGNGSAMRAAPLGLVFGADPRSMIRAAHRQSLITHQDPRCSAGSIAIAGATALALGGGALDAQAFCGRLAQWTRAYDRTLAAALDELPGWMTRPASAVLDWVRAFNREGDEDWGGISPFVTESVLWSLYAFLASPDDYWEALCTAVVVGGDVDTTAAMTGAIAGARCGLEALPREFTSRLTDQGDWGCDDLADLARRLLEVSSWPGR